MNNLHSLFDAVARKPIFPAYCDYLAHLISGNLKSNDTERLLSSVGKPEWDLDDGGALRSTLKKIRVQDRNGRTYTITIQIEV
jgi:hypothetical protein